MRVVTPRTQVRRGLVTRRSPPRVAWDRSIRRNVLSQRASLTLLRGVWCTDAARKKRISPFELRPGARERRAMTAARSVERRGAGFRRFDLAGAVGRTCRELESRDENAFLLLCPAFILGSAVVIRFSFVVRRGDARVF